MDFFKRAFNFKGRSGRLDFVLGGIYFILFHVVLLGTMSLLPTTKMIKQIISNIIFVPWTIVTIYFFVASLSLHIRRLHDLGYSGWWILCSNVPLVNLILFFILFLKKGEPNENKYGKPIGTSKAKCLN